jgi:uncharacterized protein (DUF934 family)
MALIIKNGSVTADPWQLLSAAPGDAPPALPAAGDIIVPLAAWRSSRQALFVRAGRLGVWLDSHEQPQAVADDLDVFGVVAVRFPTPTDGRGYSTARLLRERYGYRGELRAFGAVLRDQLLDLARCGFDAFALRAEEDPQAALAAFGDFSEAYQASVERPLPLFRRRSAAR